MVLGEKLWEEKGKVIGMSVKSVGPEGIHLEQTFASEIKGLGRMPSGANMGTLDAIQGPDGGFSGTGQGMFTSVDGDISTWKIYFFGKVEGAKNRSMGIVRFESASERISWMKGLVAWMEAVGDNKTGESTDTGYEWK